MTSILQSAQRAAASHPSSDSSDSSDSEQEEQQPRKKVKLTKEEVQEDEEMEEEEVVEEEEEAPQEEEEEAQEEEEAPQEEEEEQPVKVVKKREQKPAAAAAASSKAAAAASRPDPFMPFGEAGCSRFDYHSGKGWICSPQAGVNRIAPRPVQSNEIFVDEVNNKVFAVVSNPASNPQLAKTHVIKGQTKIVWAGIRWDQHFVAAELDVTVAETKRVLGTWSQHFCPKFKGAPQGEHGPPIRNGDQYRETFVHGSDNKLYPINSTGSALMMTSRKDLTTSARRAIGGHARSSKSNLVDSDKLFPLRTKGNWQIAGHLIAVLMPYYRFRYELTNINGPSSPKPAAAAAAAATPSRKRGAPSVSTDLKTAPSSLVELVNVMTEKRCAKLIEEAVASCRAQASEKVLSVRFLDWCHGLFKLYQTSKDKPDPEAALERRIRKYATASEDGVDSIQKMEVVATRHYLVSNPIGTALMEAQYNKLVVLETALPVQACDEDEEDDGLNC